MEVNLEFYAENGVVYHTDMTEATGFEHKLGSFGGVQVVPEEVSALENL